MKKLTLKKMFVLISTLYCVIPVLASGWDRAKPSDFSDDFSFGLADFLLIVMVIIIVIAVLYSIVRNLFRRN